MKEPDIVIVIPTCQRSALLGRTLDFLIASRRPERLRTIYVVENGKKENAEEVCARYADRLPIAYRYTPDASKSAALNLALSEADDEFVIYYDDDVRLDPGSVMAYVDAAAGRDRGEFYAGRCDVDYEQAPPEWLKHYLPLSAKGWNYGDKPCDLPKPLALGFNWAAFARDMKDAGGYDPEIGPGRVFSMGEETDLQKRMLARGVKGRYLPDAVVWHYIPAERCSKEWTLERNRKFGLLTGRRLAKTGGLGHRVKALAALAKVAGLRLLLGCSKGCLSEARRFHYLQRCHWNLGLWQGQKAEGEGS
jgi:glycosyltransferase involved in cell wall biosynthesis